MCSHPKVSTLKEWHMEVRVNLEHHEHKFKFEILVKYSSNPSEGTNLGVKFSKSSEGVCVLRVYVFQGLTLHTC